MSPFAVAWMALAGIPWAHSVGSIFAIIKTDPSVPSACFLEEERDGSDIWHLAPVLTCSRSNRLATEPRSLQSHLYGLLGGRLGFPQISDQKKVCAGGQT